MARPRKDAEQGESTSVPIRLSRNDLDWLDNEAQKKGYKSRAEVLRDALKYYRWSKEDRKAIEEEVARAMADPEVAAKLADAVTEKVFRKLKDGLP